MCATLQAGDDRVGRASITGKSRADDRTRLLGAKSVSLAGLKGLIFHEKKWRARKDSNLDPQIRSLVLYPAELRAARVPENGRGAT